MITGGLVVLLLLFAVACSDETKDADADAAERTPSTAPLHAEGELGDGKHFGFVAALDPQQFRLGFDEAELLEGQEAVDAAADDGSEPTDGGFYVRNPDDRMHRVTLSEDIVVRLLVPRAAPAEGTVCCELREASFEDWQAGFEPDDRTFFGTSASHYEITITDGRVTAVDEVQVP